MKPGHVLRRLAIAAACIGTVTSHAATMWDEAGNGDLSNDGLSPTPLVITMGYNRVLGTTGNGGQGIDRDHFTFTVPTGAKIASITLLDNTFVSGSVSFVGISAHPTVTAENLMGSMHYGTDLIGTDILPAMGITGGLPSGTYSVWVQETGGLVTYGFDFAMAASATVPTLPGWGVILLGMLLAFVMWRQSRMHACSQARMLTMRPIDQ